MTSAMLARGYWSHNCSGVVDRRKDRIVVYARFFVLVHGLFGHLILHRRARLLITTGMQRNKGYFMGRLSGSREVIGCIHPCMLSHPKHPNSTFNQRVQHLQTLQGRIIYVSRRLSDLFETHVNINAP
jgi:hypothetical protein